MTDLKDEIEDAINEYTPDNNEGVVSILNGRLRFSIYDIIDSMIECGIDNPKEVKKLIIRDVKHYINHFGQEAVSLDPFDPKEFR